MNTLFIAATWFGQEHRALGLNWNYLVILGMIGNVTFSMRFIVQWLASERQGESVIPVSFWYWSIGGSVIMFLYFLFRRDPVGIEIGYCLTSRPLFLTFAHERVVTESRVKRLLPRVVLKPFHPWVENGWGFCCPNYPRTSRCRFLAAIESALPGSPKFIGPV